MHKLMNQPNSRPLIICVILLALVLIAGALISLILKEGNPGISWLVTSVLLTFCTFILYLAWSLAGRGQTLAWLLAMAFLLRLFVGVVTEVGLPRWGYDETVQNSGYLFYDAYKRDNDAWALAKSSEPIWKAFENEFIGDQYGGLLSISALVYRGFSSDHHRPYLVMLLTALAGSVAVAFVWAGSGKRWGRRIAMGAALLVAVFPDAVLFGGAQMREPYLVLMTAMAFWGVVFWDTHRSGAILTILLSVIGLFLISSRVAVPALAVIAGIFIFDKFSLKGDRKRESITWISILFAALIMGALSWNWLSSSSSWDIFETIRTSGRVQYAFETIPEKFQVPFVIGYGLTQPVLPAAIVDPALPIWRIIAIFRGIGWYAVAPLLIYAIFICWKAESANDRRIMVWLSICMIIWLLISSTRAGGDQWDNPRYRSIFLVYIALLCSWAWDYARRHKDAWLGRFFLIEGIFLGFFLEWYISRYYQVVGRLPFEIMLIWVAGLSLAVVVGSLIWDRVQHKLSD